MVHFSFESIFLVSCYTGVLVSWSTLEQAYQSDFLHSKYCAISVWFRWSWQLMKQDFFPTVLAEICFPLFNMRIKKNLIFIFIPCTLISVKYSLKEKMAYQTSSLPGKCMFEKILTDIYNMKHEDVEIITVKIRLSKLTGNGFLVLLDLQPRIFFPIIWFRYFLSIDFVSDFIPVVMSGWIQVWQACSLVPQSHQCNTKKILSWNPSLLIIYFWFYNLMELCL